jgi:2'-5' RNA ligase
MRLFIAIELPEEIKRGLAEVQQRLRDGGARASWTRPEGIHLTLKFLGEVEAGKTSTIMQALETAVPGTGLLRLSVEGVSAFPNRKAPRVIWTGVAGDVERLSVLHGAIEDAMEGWGFERENRTFSPHLTLARVKFPKPRENWQQLIERIGAAKIGSFETDHINLMQSELHREGAVYTALGRIGLT